MYIYRCRWLSILQISKPCFWKRGRGSNKICQRRPQITKGVCGQHTAAALCGALQRRHRRRRAAAPPKCPNTHRSRGPLSGALQHQAPKRDEAHTRQQHQHAGSKARAATCPRSKVRTAVPSSGSAQQRPATPKPSTTHSRGTGPTPKLPSARSSSALQRHQRPSSQARAAAAPCSRTLRANSQARTAAALQRRRHPSSNTRTRSSS